MQYPFTPLLVAFLLFAGAPVSAQTNTAIVTTGDGRPLTIVDNINGAVVPVIKPTNVEGTPFLGDEWGIGTVYFAKERKADSVALRFNLFENRLYFKRDEVILLFVEDVIAFSITYKAQGVAKTTFFKKGYPGNIKQQSDVYYNVVNEGTNYHLLRRMVKTVNDIYVYNGLGTKKYSDTEEWFVFDVATGNIEKIKPDVSSLAKKLPKAASKIKQLAAEHMWDLRTETELISLFTILNDKAE